MAITATKFQRNYELLVQGNDGTLYAFAYPLTLEFNIKRQFLPYSSGSGNFKIYNLNQQHRNAIYKNSYTQALSFSSLTLKAGYGGPQSTLPIVFSGNVYQAESYRLEKALDFITNIDGYDYGWVFNNATSSRTYAANTVTQKQIALDLISDLQKVVPNDPNIPGSKLGIGFISPQYAQGKYQQDFSAVGSTWNALQNITNNQSYIDNGKVYSLFENDVFAGDVTQISSYTGLLGTPKKQDNMLIIEMLFEPRLQIGQQVQVISTSLAQYPTNNNGYYKVIGIEHRGTISGAVSGECKTIVTVMLPFEKINLITTS